MSANSNFSGFKFSKRPISSPAVPKQELPKSRLTKRKSLLTAIPWLSSKSLDDDEDSAVIPEKIEVVVRNSELNTNNDDRSITIVNAVVESQSIPTIPTQTNSVNDTIDDLESATAEEVIRTLPSTPGKVLRTPTQSPKAQPIESPLKQFSLLENAVESEIFKDHQINDHTQVGEEPFRLEQIENNNLLYASTQHQQHQHNEINSETISTPLQISEIERQNKILTAENKLYDNELNKALSMNMELESTVLKLENTLRTQFKNNLIPEDKINYQVMYESVINELNELRVREHDAQQETNLIIQDYNSLVDKYNQLKEVYTDEKLKFNQQEEDLRLFHGRFKYMSEQNSALSQENESLRAEVRRLQYEAGASGGQVETNYWKDLYRQAAKDNEYLKNMIHELSVSDTTGGLSKMIIEDSRRETPVDTSELVIRRSFNHEECKVRVSSDSSLISPKRSSQNSRQGRESSDFYASPAKDTYRASTPAKNTYSRPETPAKYQDVYAMNYMDAKRFLESELVRLTVERDVLKSEYQKLPIYGGRLKVRNRKEELDDALDEREGEIASVRKKMRDIGIL